MHDTDLELSLIQGGDAHAFARWMGSVERSLRLSLRSFAASVDVEAVLQETLLRTWNVASRIEPDGKPHALFRVALRIARNLAISEKRRLRTTAGDEALAGLAAETPVPADALLVRHVRECHDKLPDKPRAVLAARLESAGAEPDELLAERLSMRLNTFLQNFTRARKLLLECLRSRGVDTTELA